MRFILFNHLKFLKSEGYDVHAVCFVKKWQKELNEIGVNVKNIKFKRSVSFISDFITLVKLYFYLKKEKFDIVHTHTPKAGLLGQLAAKFALVPIILNTVHGFYFQKKDSWLKRKFFIFLEKIAAKCSNTVFFVNREDMKTAVEEKICRQEKIKYFGGGVNLQRFDTTRFSETFISNFKKELGLNDKKIIIGIVARMVKEKGYLDLFMAFKKVINNFPEALLLVVGDPDYEKKDSIEPCVVKKYGIENSVVFLGERTDVDRIYALMDIFILPSHREGLGISAIEALAMEKPVIVTDIRGLREVVDDGKTGKLIPTGSADQIAKAIIYMINNRKEAIEMGKKGRRKVEKEFDERIIFDRIKDEYNRLLREKYEV
jgi:glycosyltransferase involved in cell wall biosynthesis